MISILLVEDNSADVMLFREGLRQCDVMTELFIAYDGEQALRLLQGLKEAPDFIVLDLNLPKFSGFELLRGFRETGGPPVVVYSSSQNPEDRKKALELGAIDFFHKPGGFEATIRGVGDFVRGLADRARSTGA